MGEPRAQEAARGGPGGASGATAGGEPHLEATTGAGEHLRQRDERDDERHRMVAPIPATRSVLEPLCTSDEGLHPRHHSDAAPSSARLAVDAVPLRAVPLLELLESGAA